MKITCPAPVPIINTFEEGSKAIAVIGCPIPIEKSTPLVKLTPSFSGWTLNILPSLVARAMNSFPEGVDPTELQVNHTSAAS
jgi:hypothetical protein